MFLCHVTLELFIEPPWSERETQIRWSLVPAPLGQLLALRQKGNKGLVIGLKAFVQPEDLTLPDFPRKQDDKVI